MGTGRFTISIQFQICRSSCTGTSRKGDFIRDKEKKSRVYSLPDLSLGKNTHLKCGESDQANPLIYL